MTDILIRSPKIYHKRLQKSFDVVKIDYADKMVRVKKTIIKDGNVIDEIIDQDYMFYELEALQFVNKRDYANKDLIEGDNIIFGDQLE
jgi:hypothetical protein